MACVLVTDGQERAALAVVRSLARAGHTVYVVSPRGSSLAGASRYARGETSVPGSLEDPEGFAGALQEVAESRRVDVLLPVSEASLLAVLPHRVRFAEVCIPFPAYEIFRNACDKGAVLDAARRLGIPIPEQQLLTSPADRERLDVKQLEFPLVIKPHRSVPQKDGRRTKSHVVHVDSASSLSAALDRIAPSAYPLFLQQRILGSGVGVFLLLWENQLLASFAHRRLREKPPSGGVSVYRESIDADAQLIERSRALLEEFKWQGLAMVEYKVERSTRTAYLMEINPRFWGSLQLALDAGVDFPALLVSAALGENPQPVLDYRRGVLSRWWWGDVDHLLARLRHSKLELALPDEAPGRWQALVDFVIAFRPRTRNEVLRLRDPVPCLRETVNWFRRR